MDQLFLIPALIRKDHKTHTSGWSVRSYFFRQRVILYVPSLFLAHESVSYRHGRQSRPADQAVKVDRDNSTIRPLQRIITQVMVAANPSYNSSSQVSESRHLPNDPL